MTLRTIPAGVYSVIPNGYDLCDVSLPQNIDRFLREAEMSQVDLAGALGVGQGAVSKWKTGKTEPAVAMLPRIAVALGVSLDALLSGIDPTYDERAATTSKHSTLSAPPLSPVDARLLARWHTLDDEDRLSVQAMLKHYEEKRSKRGAKSRRRRSA